MRSTLDEYLLKVDNLIDYINANQNLYIIKDSSKEDGEAPVYIKYNTDINKRRYDYNLIIITLYGILEGFMEQIIVVYLENINDYVSNYQSLPEAIQNNHVVLSADLIKYTKTLSKYENILVNDIILNLNSCLNGKDKYKINVDAFTYHSSNFRKDMIRDFFKNVGVYDITKNICKAEVFIKFFSFNDGVTEDNVKKYQENKFFEYLDDLVERRNQIAHGLDIDDLLSLEILTTYGLYLKALINSIYNILNFELNKIKFNNNKKYELGKAIKVINNNIICIKNKYFKMKINDFIYGYNTVTNELRFGKILSIQINGTEVKETNCNCDEAIGLKVDFYAKDNLIYYYIEH